MVRSRIGMTNSLSGADVTRPQSPSRTRSWRRWSFRVHRWLGLFAGVFWLVQAATGVLCVFHWEAADAVISLLHRPTDLRGLEARIHALETAGSGRHVMAVWTTAGLSDDYRIFVDHAAHESTSVRVAGDGTVLVERDTSKDGPFDTIVAIHQTLLAGVAGSWIVGVSGMLLISNILLALWFSIPRRGGWRTALTPASKGPLAARLYSWHRAVGLIAAIPALALIGAGTTLVFESGVRDLLGAAPPRIAPQPSSEPPRVGFAAATQTALDVFPNSRLTAVKMPTAADATYEMHVLATDEIRRAYGTSVVFVDSMTGHVRGVFPANAAPAARAFVDGLYAVHTGEIGGLAGRLIVLSLGFWLLAMIGLGISLWVSRRNSNLVRQS
jgi:uncharacterized iron-regulated membrane protein